MITKNNSFLKITSLLLLSSFLLSSCATGTYTSPEKAYTIKIDPVGENKPNTKTKSVAKNEPSKNEICFLNRCPTGAPKNNFLVNHHIYILSSNRKTKFADWVAYVVSKSNLNGPPRSRIWKKDPFIPSAYTFLPEDYQQAAKACDYDRGHQAPLSSFSNSPYWERTNYLSNITPQKASLNRGAWLKLEKAVRRLASDGSIIYVVTGPIYQQDVRMCTLPKKTNVVIPTDYFKVIFKPTSKGVSYAAFIMSQNTKMDASMCQYAVTLKKVREMTKLKFLNNQIKREATLLKPLGC